MNVTPTHEPISLAYLAQLAGASVEEMLVFTGAGRRPDPRTGRTPEPWEGKGVDALFDAAAEASIIRAWQERQELIEDDLLEGGVPAIS